MATTIAKIVLHIRMKKRFIKIRPALVEKVMQCMAVASTVIILTLSRETVTVLRY